MHLGKIPKSRVPPFSFAPLPIVALYHSRLEYRSAQPTLDFIYTFVIKVAPTPTPRSTYNLFRYLASLSPWKTCRDFGFTCGWCIWSGSLLVRSASIYLRNILYILLLVPRSPISPMEAHCTAAIPVSLSFKPNWRRRSWFCAILSLRFNS